MKEHGLIRTGEMVRAFLDGRKTQTRLRIKRLPIHADYGEPQWDHAWLDSSYDPPCLKVPYVGGPMGETTQRHFCKYAVGDLVYVRTSRYMAKVRARLWCPIIEIKAPERARDISEADAIAEGVLCEAYDGMTPISGCWWDYERKCWSGAFPNGREATGSFLTLWQSLYSRTDEWTWPLVLGERIQRCGHT